MSQVVIGDILPYTQAIATGGQTVFGTNWTANYESDVVVYKTPVGDEPNDVTQVLPYPAGYSVAFIGSQQDVQVTLVVPALIGERITITRQTPADRENLYTNTNFVPSMLNNDFGILTLVDQQAQLVDQKIGPRYNYSAIIVDVTDTILPILGAGQIWAKDPTNSFIEAVDLSTVISGGTVTQINTGLGLTGGPITTVGTISFGTMNPNTFWGNITGGVAVPTQVTTGYFLQTANNLSDITNQAAARNNLGLNIGSDVQAWNAALQSISGLTTVANNMLYTTASNTYAVIAPLANASLVSSAGSVPSWSQTLPQAVQTNIQYLGIQNQNLNMGGFQINNGADPTQPSDFATKNYVDLNALTGTSVYAASAASLGTVTQAGSGAGATLTNAGVQATFALDGVNPPLNSIVLIKNTATGMTAANEGIYTVTNVGSGASNWVLTRSTSYDTPAEINQTGLIIVQNGSTLAGTAWYNAVTIVTVDVTNFSYSQFGNIIFPVSLSNGGTNASLVASAGSVTYSTATAMAFSAVGSAGQLFQSAGTAAPGWTTATYPGTATGTGTLLRADGTNWSPTTTTYPATNAINTIMYASSANVMGVITPVFDAVMVSGASGIPSWSLTLPSGLTIPGYAHSGANSDITSMSGLTGYLQFPAGIKDASGNIVIGFGSVASAVNTLNVYNAVAGGNTFIQNSGASASIPLELQPKNADLWLSDTSNTIAPSLRFYNAARTQYTALKAATAQATTLTLTLPAADAAVSGNAMVSNAAGVLSFLTLPTLTKVVYQIFTASGTYTPTSGMKYCIIECVGGGGAGGGAAAAGAGAGTGGGGGGGGSYASIVSTAATIGASQTVTIGAGGTAGTAGNNAGNAGGDTSVGSICIGKGGGGGSGSAGAAGGAGGAGGVTGTGSMTIVGGNGDTGQYAGVTTVMPTGGGGGESIFGHGAGNYHANGASNGLTGTGYGGGGGGGLTYNNSGTVQGGIGQAGVVRITEFVSI